MKKSLFTGSSSLLVVLCFASVCPAVFEGIAIYDGAQVTRINNPSTLEEGAPKINNEGTVVWRGWDGAGDGVFLYDGSEITRIYYSPYGVSAYQIRDNGWVVWIGYDGDDNEIFLYDGDATTQVTDNDYDDRYVEANDSGELVWSGCDSSDCEIFLYDGMAIHQITDNDYDDTTPLINNMGQIVWTGRNGPDREIFFYDGATVRQLTDNERDDSLGGIGDNGWVVWQRWEGSDYDIFLYDGTTTTNLTDNDYNDSDPHLNNVGEVVWSGRPDGSQSEVFLYDGASTVQLTDGTYSTEDHVIKDINDNGQIVWMDYHAPDYMPYFYDGAQIVEFPAVMGGGGELYLSENGYVAFRGLIGTHDSEIFLYDGTRLRNLSNNLGEDVSPHMSKDGKIAWIELLPTDTQLTTWDVPVASSTLGAEYREASKAVNLLVFLFLPVGAVLVWKRLKG
jgi:hypothetical protein